MKRLVAILSIVLCVITTATAQPRAIGGRIGGDIDFSYQHALGSRNMLDLSAGVGFGNYFSIGVAGAYDWLFPIKGWNHPGAWTFYAGPAAGLYVNTSGKIPIGINIGGQVGIEYTFEFPLNISLDYRPLINILGFVGSPKLGRILRESP